MHAAAIADELAHHTHPEEGGEEDEPREAAPGAGETVTVTGDLTAAPRLDRTPVPRGFAISDGVPCPNCGYVDAAEPRVHGLRAAATPDDTQALAAAEALAERRSPADRAETR